MTAIAVTVRHSARCALRFAAGVGLAFSLNAPVSAQVTGGCSVPARERPSPFGCYVDATKELGVLPRAPLFWHLYTYPTRAAANAAKVSRSSVVEAFTRVWLYTIAETSWRPSSGVRVAVVGPLPISAGKRYTARYLEAQFKPGMRARPHRHSGPEAFFLLSGTQCLQTPAGIIIAHAGESSVIAGGQSMTVKSVGAQTRRAVVLVLHDTSEAWQTLTGNWKPKNLCPG